MKTLLHLQSEFLSGLGVLDWGYTEEAVPASLAHYERWVNEGQQGPLKYLADHRRDARRDIRHVYPEFQSALVFLFSYQPAKKWMLENQRHEVAAYTLAFGGEDYHQALKRHLDSIFLQLKDQLPELERFVALDAQPILERDLAYRAGLGWFGKNSMLIHQKEGSYFILGSLLLNQKLKIESGTLDVDHCGQCNACVEACPTQVIDPVTRTIDAANCISTFTIEIFKEAQAPEGFEKSRGEIFGCDICQDVCPWNRKPLGRVESQIVYRPEYAFLEQLIYDRALLAKTLEVESNRGVRRKFAGTAFERPGKEGWLKNLK